MTKKDHIEVVKCGSMAVINLGQCEAMVTAVTIRFGSASYELSYFYSGEMKTVWLYESEFTVVSGGKTHIGFR